MKIIASFSKDKKMSGLAAALLSANIEYIVWNYQLKPAYDMYDEIKPDVILTDEPWSTTGIAKLSASYPNIRIISINQAAEYMGDGGYLGDKSYILKAAANLAAMIYPNKLEKYNSDILYISHGSNIPDVVTEMIGTKYKVKIVGDITVDNPCYVGKINYISMAAFIKNTTVGIDIEEDYYDYAANKSFCLTNFGFLYPDISKDNLIQALENDEYRQGIINNAHEITIRQHTYHHAAIAICRILGWEDGVQQISNTLEAIKCNLASY